MLPSSLTVTLAITILGLLTVAAFAWAWRKGQFDRLQQQALLPMDDDEILVVVRARGEEQSGLELQVLRERGGHDAQVLR